MDLDVSPKYPICYKDGEHKLTIGVAGLGSDDQKVSSSNFGSACVDISAPGNKIFGAQYVNSADPDFQELYGGYWSGTSLASPIVTGVLALMRAYAPQIPAEKLKELLLQTVDPIDLLNPQYLGKLGKGRVNAYKALEALKAYTQSLPPPSPPRPPAKLLEFTINNSATLTASLAIPVTVKTENTRTMMIVNGDPLASPLCDFSFSSSIPYIEETLWKLADGPAGARLVCLKLEGQDLLVYKSVFYTPPPPLEPVKHVITITRDLEKEKLLLPKAAVIFKKITGRAPDTNNPLDKKALVTLVYDVQYARDLAKEQMALKKFVKIFKRTPKTSLDWNAVRVLAYVL